MPLFLAWIGIGGTSWAPRACRYSLCTYTPAHLHKVCLNLSWCHRRKQWALVKLWILWSFLRLSSIKACLNPGMNVSGLFFCLFFAFFFTNKLKKLHRSSDHYKSRAFRVHVGCSCWTNKAQFTALSYNIKEHTHVTRRYNGRAKCSWGGPVAIISSTLLTTGVPMVTTSNNQDFYSIDVFVGARWKFQQALAHIGRYPGEDHLSWCWRFIFKMKQYKITQGTSSNMEKEQRWNILPYLLWFPQHHHCIRLL